MRSAGEVPKLNPPLLKLATRHDDEVPRVQFGRYYNLEPLEETILVSILLQAKGKKKGKFVEERLRRTYVNRFVLEAGMQCLRTDKESLYEIVQRERNVTELSRARNTMPAVPSTDEEWEAYEKTRGAWEADYQIRKSVV